MKTFIRVLGGVGLAVVTLLVISSIIYSPEYMFRVIKYGQSDVDDMYVFSSRDIEPSDDPFTYNQEIDLNIGNIMVNESDSLLELLEKSSTTSFLIVHNNDLIYEYYSQGHDAKTQNTSFSSVKSIVSLLIGIAVDEGYITSEKDRLDNYIHELSSTEIGKITIEELLRMRSPIKYREGMLWFGDDARTYYAPSLRELAIHETKIDQSYNGQFHYNNYHPLLLGVVLERSTGMSVAKYFEEKIWEKIGAEYAASWSLDSEESSFEKMESGLNFAPVDYAKIGSMLLNDGKLNGNTIVSEGWLEKSIYPSEFYRSEEYEDSFLKDRNTGYQFMWYSENDGRSKSNFYAAGRYGQYIYISPEARIVIVRTGSSEGPVEWWPDLLHEVVAGVVLE